MNKKNSKEVLQRLMSEEFPDKEGKANPVFERAKNKLKELMDPSIRHKAMAMHHAGATVGPVHPFTDLSIFRNTEQLSTSFIEKWVSPYYLKIPFCLNNSIKEKLKQLKDEISGEVIKFLLGDFNWRSRSVGAYFAALTRHYELFPTLGNMLLQSEVCIAGKVYTIALASYDRTLAIPIYLRYLKYYLAQPQYAFDQSIVGAALVSLTVDKIEYRDQMLEIYKMWKSFVSQRHFDNFAGIDDEIDRFHAALTTLIEIRDG